MKYNHVLHMCNTLVIHDTITLAIIHKITLTQLTDCIIVIFSCNSHLFQFKKLGPDLKYLKQEKSYSSLSTCWSVY